MKYENTHYARSSIPISPRLYRISDFLSLTKGEIIDGNQVQTGQVITISLDFTSLKSTTGLQVGLNIFNPSGESISIGELTEIESVSEGPNRIDFYVIVNLLEGVYAFAFDFYSRDFEDNRQLTERLEETRKTKTNNDNDNDHEMDWKLESRNNLFIEFSVCGAQVKTSLRPDQKTSKSSCIYSIATVSSSASFQTIHGKHAESNHSSNDFPWPISEERFSRSEIADAMRRILNGKHCNYSKSTSLMTSLNGPRIFNFETPRLGTQVGRRIDGKIVSNGAPGFLLYGPYLPIMQGCYSITLRGLVKTSNAQISIFEVVARKAQLTLSAKEISTSVMGNFEISLDFEVPACGYKDVEFRVKVPVGGELQIEYLILTPTEKSDNSAADNLTKLACELLLPANNDIAGVLAYREKYLGIAFVEPKYPRLLGEKEISVIFVPIDAFLPFCLAVADYIKDTYGIKSIFIYQEWSPLFSYSLSCSQSIFEILSTTDFLEFFASNQFNVQIFISHSFAWEEVINKVLQKVEPAVFMVYADGFKQSIHSTYNKYKNINGAISFGSHPISLSVRLEKIINPNAVIEWYKKLSKSVEISNKNKFSKNSEAYAAVYLRYYGAGPYDFDNAIALMIMTETIVDNVDEGTDIVVKNDKRVPVGIMDSLLLALKAKGYRAISLEGYLLNCDENPRLADISAEFLFLNGYLCDAVKHICFDSTICYSLVALKEYLQPTEVVIGANLDFLNEAEIAPNGYLVSADVDKNKSLFVSQKSISVIKDCSKILADYIVNSPFFGDLRFARKSSQDTYLIQVNKD